VTLEYSLTFLAHTLETVNMAINEKYD